MSRVVRTAPSSRWALLVVLGWVIAFIALLMAALMALRSLPSGERATIRCDEGGTCQLLRSGAFTSSHRIGSFTASGIHLVADNCLPGERSLGTESGGRGPLCRPGMWVSGWDGEPTGKPYGVRGAWSTTVPPDAVWVPFVSKAHESWQPHLADAIDERVRAGKPWTLAISTAWPTWFGFPAQAATLVIAPLGLVGLVVVTIRTAKAAPPQPRTT